MRNSDAAHNQNAFNNAKKGHRERVSESITPLFVKWLKSACSFREGDVIKLDEFILDKIVVCGRVVSLKSDATKTFLVLDDGTDSIKVVSNKRHDEEHSKSYKDIVISSDSVTYLKVIIDVNFYQNEVIFTPIKVSPVPNHNYITFHILNCLQAQKVRVQGFPKHPPQEDRFATSAARKSEGVGNRYVNMNVHNMQSGSTDSSNSEKLVRDTINFMKRKTNRAVSLEELVGQLQNQLSRPAIVAALKSLTELAEIRKIPGQEIYDFY